MGDIGRETDHGIMEPLPVPEEAPAFEPEPVQAPAPAAEPVPA